MSHGSHMRSSGKRSFGEMEELDGKYCQACERQVVHYRDGSHVSSREHSRGIARMQAARRRQELYITYKSGAGLLHLGLSSCPDDAVSELAAMQGALAEVISAPGSFGEWASRSLLVCKFSHDALRKEAILREVFADLMQGYHWKTLESVNFKERRPATGAEYMWEKALGVKFDTLQQFPSKI